MQLPNIYIKETTSADLNDILRVEELAFGEEDEAQLTADLLKDDTAKPVISLLAYRNDEAVGHILFTRGYLDNMELQQPLFHILAPLAVIPTHQKQGIGGILITEGLKRLKEMGSQFAFVLGHIEYYPKYGFINDANSLGYKPPYPIPEKDKDAWMVQSLSEGELSLKNGRIICADAMNKREYWRE